MSDSLSHEEFAAFFKAVHRFEPFPWQKRLAKEVFTRGWPMAERAGVSVLDVPTGAGKTAAIDIAVFHLALQAHLNAARLAPVRILFVVDRRLIVDDAYLRARKIAEKLSNPDCAVVERVATSLAALAEENGPPLAVARLRGGTPKEPDWARTPTQPTVLVSTIDQVGSRMLFRGYGVSDVMKPVHAGLLGSDALLLLDEAHLSQAFVQTAHDMRRFQRAGTWSEDRAPAPFAIVKLSATQSDETALVRGDDDELGPLLRRDDEENQILGPRLRASKSVELIKCEAKADDTEFAKDFAVRARGLAENVERKNPTVAIVVNRVKRARQVYDELIRSGCHAFAMQEAEVREEDEQTAPQVALLIGRVRDLDRQELLDQLLPCIKAGADRQSLNAPLYVVATQSIEAGADLDFDALVAEIAPLDSLRQRFGRLNRMGRPINASGAIIAASDQVSKSSKPDPIYGDRIRQTWAFLEEKCQPVGKKKQAKNVIDFGLVASRTWVPTGAALAPLIAPRSEAPVLLPRDITFWTMTSPIPAVDPEVSLYLHGPNSGRGEVEIVWRADLDHQTAAVQSELKQQEEWIERISVCPPSALEALSVPIAEAKRWLRDNAKADISDVEGRDAEEDERRPKEGVKALRWRGAEDERTRLVATNDISPGDIIVVPSSRGGCDRWGWNPPLGDHVVDRGRMANRLQRNRDILRPDLAASERIVGDEMTVLDWAALAEMNGREIRAAFEKTITKDESFERYGPLRVLRSNDGRVLALEQSIRAKRTQSQKRPGGGSATAATRIDPASEPATEGSDGLFVPAGTVLLTSHCEGVSNRSRRFAEQLGLDARLVDDIALAGLLHDTGKSHPAFKRLLYGSAILAALAGPALAKSAKRPGSRIGYAEACHRAGLEIGARHEIASLAFADEYLASAPANDPDLVLWLIGTHHGYGRPFFPAVQWPPIDGQKIEPGLNGSTVSATCKWSLAELVAQWVDLAARVQKRYGPWGLARLEALLRLADHRQSEDEGEQAEKEASNPNPARLAS